MQKRNIFSVSTGLNTVLDPTRIKYDPTSGVTDLAVAVNVDIDQSGRITRRKGRKKVSSENLHSLYCNKGPCVVVKERTNDAALMNVANDFSLTGIRSGISKDRRMAFAQAHDRLYYSNGVENGYVKDGASNPWVLTEHVGAPTTRQFFEAPVGDHLELAVGRMLIAKGNVLYWSEPLSYGEYDLTRSFVQFESRILMVKYVAGGTFVSDEQATWFFQGIDIATSTQIQVATYPAVEWSDAVDLVDLQEQGFDSPGLAAIWVSKKGVCLGTPDGSMINLTSRKVNYPTTARRGMGVVHNDKFIHSLED